MAGRVESEASFGTWPRVEEFVSFYIEGSSTTHVRPPEALLDLVIDSFVNPGSSRE